MKSFAREYVIFEEDAEDIVQDVFLDLVGIYDSLANKINIVAYIFTSIKNRSIDHLRRKILKEESANHIQEELLLSLRMKFDSLEVLNEDLFSEESVEKAIEKALQKLPEKCRLIFIKHKIEGKKQKEIAQELSLSPKTVENQLTIAYRKLREELKKYSSLLVLLC